ncbi:excinuclease ABC subunit UvrC [Candidatus Saccharibacteria bacterium]|nr:excinuclease ABC subunit UvrC [Candidatus Saccharibacteria bacterium]
MTDDFRKKLSTLPKSSGVYFHKDKTGEVIYVGKAAVLNNRVRQYFQKSRTRDPKTEALVAEIVDTDWIETDSEIDALFLEAEMVKRYMPRFNILLRDDKSLEYVRMDINSDRPTVTFTRRPLDDGAEYFGPYVNGWAVKRALKYLRRIFPYLTQESRGVSHESRNSLRSSRLYRQIGLEPDLSTDDGLKAYRVNLRMLAKYMRGKKIDIAQSLEKQMKQAAKQQKFEEATMFRNKMLAMKGLQKQIIFSDQEFMDLSRDKGLSGLADLLALSKIPKRIEGFDISHMSGTDVVASMVVFTNGLPDKKEYRKFKLRVQQNNDFASMFEVITRRLSEKNRKAWGVPDLFLIDGGKGQLASALSARDSLQGQTLQGINVPMVGLAKREEQVVVSHESRVMSQELGERARKLHGYITDSDDFILVNLPHTGDVVKLIQRIRDESHRFAVSYHSTLKQNRQTTSWLDEVPTIGPATKRKLIKTFGSARGVVQARDFELVKVLGDKKAEILKQYIRLQKK